MNKKDPRRQLIGKASKVKGQQFEARLDASFAYYALKGYAIVEKTPEPTTKSRPSRTTRGQSKAGAP